MNPNPWLVATSTTFLLPATLFAYKGIWHLYYSNIAVVAVSAIYHATKLTPLYYIDVATANTLAILHTLWAIEKGVGFVPVPGILYSLLMFWIGHQNREFIWHPDITYATLWHMSMHMAVFSCVTTLALLTN
jgi:hypothetical protein